MEKKGKRKESGLLEGSLQLTSLIPEGDPSRKALYEKLHAAVPSSAASRGGISKSPNLSRQDHSRGLRHKKPRLEAPRLDP